MRIQERGERKREKRKRERSRRRQMGKRGRGNSKNRQKKRNIVGENQKWKRKTKKYIHPATDDAAIKENQLKKTKERKKRTNSEGVTREHGDIAKRNQ